MLLIRTIVVTPFAQNARVLWDSSSPESTVVDPGGNVEEILAVINAEKLQVSQVFLTHAHLDHVGGTAKILSALEKRQGKRPKLFAHRLEKEMRAQVSETAALFGLSPNEYQNVPEPDVYVDGGDKFIVGELSAAVLFTPGHSPGHVALYFPGEKPLVLSGDALFAGSIGRTDLPGGDHATLITGIKEKLLTLPDNTQVLSGHGPDTTIGREKSMNPFLQG